MTFTSKIPNNLISQSNLTILLSQNEDGYQIDVVWLPSNRRLNKEDRFCPRAARTMRLHRNIAM